MLISDFSWGQNNFAPILFYTGRKRIDVYLDKEFEGKKIAVHPNDNTATIYLQADDLIRLIKEHGNEVELSEL